LCRKHLLLNAGHNDPMSNEMFHHTGAVIEEVLSRV